MIQGIAQTPVVTINPASFSVAKADYNKVLFHVHISQYYPHHSCSSKLSQFSIKDIEVTKVTRQLFQQMEIIIKPLTGKIFSVRVLPQYTIARLKTLIQLVTGSPCHQQRLLFKGHFRRLSDPI